MRKFIVTTTINPPTEAIKKFAALKDWQFIIVGDLITPHEGYQKLEKEFSNVIYLSPESQEKKFNKLSKAIGWRKIQRRNIGYVEAYLQGAEIIATVDDDNIPGDDWGEEIFIGKSVRVNYYTTTLPAFDPVGATNTPLLWHRGYPLELIPKRNYSKKNAKRIIPDIQADFWNGDPDIDAICRMIYAPEVKYQDNFFPMAANKISPFNSQNTFLSRKVIKDYFLFPFVGRMDDIWASYYVQAKGYKVMYNKPTVYQARNVHNLIKDMQAEYIGYENNLKIIEAIADGPDKFLSFLPNEAVKAFEVYAKHFG